MLKNDANHVVRLAPHVAKQSGTLLRAKTAIPTVNPDASYVEPTRLKGSALRRTIKVAIEDKRRHSLTSTFGLTLATGVLGKVASILLIPMIFFQPFLPLYAADESVAPAPEAPPPVVESAPAPVVDEPAPTEVPAETPTETEVAPPTEEAPPAPAEEVVPEPEAQPEVIAEAEESAPSPDETTPPPDVEAGVPPADTPPPDVPVEISVSTDEGIDATTTEDMPAPVGSTGTGTGTGSTEDEGTSTPPVSEVPLPGDEASTTEAVVTSETSDEEATTTDEVVGDEEIIPENPDLANLPDAGVALDREAQLRAELKREVEAEFLSGCISFEHTGYYCMKDGAGGDSGVEPKETTVSVEAEQGTGGDKEIFIDKDGVRTQLTDNDWDDAFPAQDISGKHFIWQGMKGGRWQIFYADTTGSDAPRVSQVTDSRESNFNPKVDGDHIVWQGWVDENWEVFLATRREYASPLAGEHLPIGNRLMNVGPEWAVERLTENTEHDMFPSLHGDIITWQAHEGANWVVYAYSITQKTRTKLSTDGVKSENPRFAITWEERDAEGRARLMSYDVATGEKVDLTSVSRRLPDNPFRAPPVSPISQKDQAALPTSGSSTSTTARGEDDAGADNPVMP